MLFKDKKPDSGTHRVSVGDIYFWGEQKGPIEDEFKAKLIASNLFKAEVKEAYLMRVRYPEATTENVALCLISDTGHEPELVRKIGEISNQRLTATNSSTRSFSSTSTGSECAPSRNRFSVVNSGLDSPYRWLFSPLETAELKAPDWLRGIVTAFQSADAKCLHRKMIWPMWLQ
jgi:hypothetical protein